MTVALDHGRKSSFPFSFGTLTVMVPAPAVMIRS